MNTLFMTGRIDVRHGLFHDYLNEDISMMNRIVAGGAVALMFGFSTAVLAQGPTWNYMSASWVVSGELEAGSTSEDLEGFQLTATKSLGDMFFVRVAANNLGADIGFAVVDFSNQQLGGGARFGVASGVDLWAAVNYDRFALDGLVGRGFGLEAGVRWQVMKELELGLTYRNSPNVDFDLGDGKFSGYELSAVYNVTPMIGALLTISSNTFEIDGSSSSIDTKNVVGLGVRLAY